jgi:hypothetical protein
VDAEPSAKLTKAIKTEPLSSLQLVALKALMRIENLTFLNLTKIR